jgi:hypothetical protein
MGEMTSKYVSLAIPSQIAPFAEPLSEVIGKVPPFLRIANTHKSTGLNRANQFCLLAGAAERAEHPSNVLIVATAQGVK